MKEKELVVYTTKLIQIATQMETYINEHVIVLGGQKCVPLTPNCLKWWLEDINIIANKFYDLIPDKEIRIKDETEASNNS